MAPRSAERILSRRCLRWAVHVFAAGTLQVGSAALASATLAPEIAYLHEQAVGGDVLAQFDLAIVLLCGKLVPRDPAQAALWLALASAKDDRNAQSVLGWQLMSGTGVRRDDRHAARWLESAAKAGDAAAQNNLGVLYALGHGVAKDRVAAQRWFGAAAAQGATYAAQNLEQLQRRGVGARQKAMAPPPTHPALIRAGCAALPSASNARTR